MVPTLGPGGDPSAGDRSEPRVGPFRLGENWEHVLKRLPQSGFLARHRGEDLELAAVRSTAIEQFQA
jgi:hypothetical protein